MICFPDREAAGRQLAAVLKPRLTRPDALVLALPRGGVPVAFEVARLLHLPLDLMLVRKLGVPGHEELAMGAIADGGVEVINEDIVRSLSIGDHTIAAVAARERAELDRRSRVYRQGRPAPELKNRTVILVDDGCATGATMEAAIQASRRRGAAWIIAAAPVASDSAFAMMGRLADEAVCVAVPEPFYGVGRFYTDFGQTQDSEVMSLLARAAETKRQSHVS
ncbi:phosphoribosyltransferase [Asticcacaulis taihuensis]|uniref:Predicted phosphoribosyltransferase n=1 Tax=Asticcacaulis taihuensis TaxID=260084 RepID=A0A1G4TFH7_9CAUL|nr:phosphoribosyltransferase family protein [Asticcacaulis taihuensis]SCW80173.1 Predicted phosphoribosyltransferase [Asticcacaulis taihuensis]